MTEITIVRYTPRRRGVNRLPGARGGAAGEAIGSLSADEALKRIREAFQTDAEANGAATLSDVAANAGVAPRQAPAKKGDALLTARADLLEIRKALLDGNCKSALRRTDWLLDCLEEEIMGG